MALQEGFDTADPGPQGVDIPGGDPHPPSVRDDDSLSTPCATLFWRQLLGEHGVARGITEGAAADLGPRRQNFTGSPPVSVEELANDLSDPVVRGFSVVPRGRLPFTSVSTASGCLTSGEVRHG